MLVFTRALALLTAGVTAAGATGALAAPRAESALECGIAADMAVVAHSLAREQVQRTKADTIMARIYDVSQSDRAKELMQEILDAAYVSSGVAAQNSGQQFAEDLFATCMKSGGDMDPVLGKKL
jgi:lipopolysaccharide export LptBFGC system permease protein LptF